MFIYFIKLILSRLILLGIFWVCGISLAWSNSLMTAANNALTQGKFKKAEFLFKQAEKQGLSPIIINYNLAYVYFRQEKIHDTVSLYQKVIADAPLSASAYQNLARVYYYYEEMEKSIVVLENFLKLVTNDYDTHLLLGDLYREMEAYDEAERQYATALDLNREYEEAYLALADLYLSLEDSPRALDYIQEALSIVLPSLTLLDKESSVYQSLGQYLQAATVQEQIIKISTNVSAEEKYLMRYELANIYLDGDFYLLAAKELQEIIDTFPGKEEPIKLLGYIYNSTDRMQLAFNLYQKIYPINKKLGYLGMRQVFAKAFNEEDEYLIKIIVKFYDKYNIKDQIYRLLKS